MSIKRHSTIENCREIVKYDINLEPFLDKIKKTRVLFAGAVGSLMLNSCNPQVNEHGFRKDVSEITVTDTQRSKNEIFLKGLKDKAELLRYISADKNDESAIKAGDEYIESAEKLVATYSAINQTQQEKVEFANAIKSNPHYSNKKIGLIEKVGMVAGAFMMLPEILQLTTKTPGQKRSNMLSHKIGHKEEDEIINLADEREKRELRDKGRHIKRDFRDFEEVPAYVSDTTPSIQREDVPSITEVEPQENQLEVDNTTFAITEVGSQKNKLEIDNKTLINKHANKLAAMFEIALIEGEEITPERENKIRRVIDISKTKFIENIGNHIQVIEEQSKHFSGSTKEGNLFGNYLEYIYGLKGNSKNTTNKRSDAQKEKESDFIMMQVSNLMEKLEKNTSLMERLNQPEEPIPDAA